LAIVAVGVLGFFTMAAQLPDKILLNGRLQQLFSNPLEHYWLKSEKKRPAFYSLPNCRRGYVATWEVLGKQLHLREIDGNHEKVNIFFRKETTRFSIKDIFPKSLGRLVKANWFSGKLRIPQGKMTTYDDDYGSRFEQEMIITVEKGDIIKIATLDYTNRTLIINTRV